MALKKVLAIGATLVMSVGFTAGVALADDSASTDVSLSVLCTELSDIAISGDGTFDTIDIANNDTSSSTAPEALLVEVNSGCDLGPWHVDAEVTRFSSGLLGFSGDKFSLEAGTVTSFFDGTGFPVPQAPTANDAEFSPISGPPPGDAESDDPIFETTNIVVFGWPTPFDYPAPFISTATFTGHLDDLGTVPPGDYTATLTVILVKD